MLNLCLEIVCGKQWHVQYIYKTLLDSRQRITGCHKTETLVVRLFPGYARFNVFLARSQRKQNIEKSCQDDVEMFWTCTLRIRLPGNERSTTNSFRHQSSHEYNQGWGSATHIHWSTPLGCKMQKCVETSLLCSLNLAFQKNVYCADRNAPDYLIAPKKDLNACAI